MRRSEKGAWQLWAFCIASVLVHAVWLFSLSGASSAVMSTVAAEVAPQPALTLAIARQQVAPPRETEVLPQPQPAAEAPQAQVVRREAAPRPVAKPVAQAEQRPAQALTKAPASDSVARELVNAVANTALAPVANPAPPSPPTPVVTREPRYAESPQSPTYPPLARRRGWQGAVWLEIPVSAQGETGRPVLLKSSGFELLDQAALAAAGDWRFVPEYRDGRAVPTRVQIPVEFALR